MTAPTFRTADLIHQLTKDAFDAAAEGRAWEAAASRASGLYLETLERMHALEAAAAETRVLELLVQAGRLQPPLAPAPRRTGRERPQ